MADDNMTREDRRKARRLAREQARAGHTTSNIAERAKAVERRAAIVSENAVTIPLMLGDVAVGKATISISGNIIARISESSLGQALYPVVKEGLVSSLQLGATIWPEFKEQLVDREETLFKVRRGLLDAGLDDQQVTDSINQMLNQGILFREKA
jgi:hypothetical protein